MTREHSRARSLASGWSCALLSSLALACSARDGGASLEAARAGSTAATAAPRAPNAQELALAPRDGNHPLDQRIRTLQRRVPDSKVPAAELERLGWTFIARARELADPGSYQLALQCALAMERYEAQSHGAL
ncbi:MAG TPA: hypothetical protein VK509_08040, partial [Polyangiales bacterium]|nr:hypothetical protein [Polyangiales bacterium]